MLNSRDTRLRGYDEISRRLRGYDKLNRCIHTIPRHTRSEERAVWYLFMNYKTLRDTRLRGYDEICRRLRGYDELIKRQLKHDAINYWHNNPSPILL